MAKLKKFKNKVVQNKKFNNKFYQKVVFKKDFYKSALIRTTMKFVIIALVSVSLILNWFTFVMPIVKYYGTSMSPTLEDGQILIVNKMSDVESGDIIAFYYNNKVLVRRVIASGNDQISIDVFGKVFVNGDEIQENYIESKTLGQCNMNFPYNVPTDSFFVLGDNRKVSMDSRLEEIGVVSEDRLIGKVVISLKPIRFIK